MILEVNTEPPAMMSTCGTSPKMSSPTFTTYRLQGWPTKLQDVEEYINQSINPKSGTRSKVKISVLSLNCLH